MLWGLLAVVVLLWVLQRRWSMRRLTALGNQLKTNLKAYPVIGHSYMFSGTGEERMRGIESIGKDAIAVGGISKFSLFNYPLMTCVSDPVIAEVVMSRCLEKHELVKIIAFVVGDGSITAPVRIWRPRRKINATVFHSRNQVQFFEISAEQSTALADLLEKKADKGTFSCWEYVSSYSINNIWEFVTGAKLEEKESELSHALESLWEIGTSTMFKPWLSSILFLLPLYGIIYQHDSTMSKLLQSFLPFMPLYKRACKYQTIVRNYITNVIKEKQNQIINNTGQAGEARCKSSFLELQLKATEKYTEHASRFTEQELFEELIVLIAGGYDATATAAAFVILMMGRHADLQEKSYKEIQSVFGDSDRPVVYEDLVQLKYLEAVIKETLRFYPPVPVIHRTVSEDVELPCHITLAKDCGVFVSIWAIHRNPEYWGLDAEQFRPERFLDYTPKHPAAFMPFSYGARSCLGYRLAMISLKTMLCTLLRRFEFVALPGVAQGAPLRTKYNMLLKHVDNYETQLKRRV